ncbi:MOSC domain-containing protein [Salinigranum rubrum]|uniref:MOSC domain-containing protein n=1 Tax=Salinigranum rubrum TaxID=755307 RepID=A0A2I8VJC6_9EURY|nr:MOSC N-terminal beta barrel domain-containing protein [Salinigranum rubrum]AUV82026.1 MOSC domain-containing protein [Salinigranum rubrum]
MTDTDPDPHLARITVYPVKSLDGVDCDGATFTPGGALAHDRTYALVDEEGRYVNGKRERAVHRLRSSFDVETRRLDLSAPDRESTTFDLSLDDENRPRDAEALSEWLSAYFEYPVSLRHDRVDGFPDDTEASGPTLISTATIREVASWFEDIDEAGMRRRLRANLELGGVPPFWEDHLFADRDSVVSFSLGDVELDGVNPCQRCVVPSRDPDTGEGTAGFRERFIERREATMPPWSGGDWFDHSFRLMVNTRAADVGGQKVSVGDSVSVGETRPADETDGD